MAICSRAEFVQTSCSCHVLLITDEQKAPPSPSFNDDGAESDGSFDPDEDPYGENERTAARDSDDDPSAAIRRAVMSRRAEDYDLDQEIHIHKSLRRGGRARRSPPVDDDFEMEDGEDEERELIHSQEALEQKGIHSHTTRTTR